MGDALPYPDGTPVGDLRHTLAANAGAPDDTLVLAATLTEQGEVTGISLGDLRDLYKLAVVGEAVIRAWENVQER
ncbi:MAG: hypothetical protein WC054_00460 [Candidatus Nanopelagicales bacterium]